MICHTEKAPGTRKKCLNQQAGTLPAVSRNTHHLRQQVVEKSCPSPFSLPSGKRVPNSLLGKHLEDIGEKKASFGISKTLPFHACFPWSPPPSWPRAPEPASCLPQVTGALNVHKAPLCLSDVIRQAWPAPRGKTAAEPGWPDPELKQDPQAAE